MKAFIDSKACHFTGKVVWNTHIHVHSLQEVIHMNITYELHMRSFLHLSFQSTCSKPGVFAQQTVCNHRLDRNLASCRSTWPAGWVSLSLWEQRLDAFNTHAVQMLRFLYLWIIVCLPSYEKCGHRCPLDIPRFKHWIFWTCVFDCLGKEI